MWDNCALLDMTLLNRVASEGPRVTKEFSSRALLMRGMVEGSRVIEGSRVVCVFVVVDECVDFDERVYFEHG